MGFNPIEAVGRKIRHTLVPPEAFDKLIQTTPLTHEELITIGRYEVRANYPSVDPATIETIPVGTNVCFEGFPVQTDTHVDENTATAWNHRYSWRRVHNYGLFGAGYSYTVDEGRPVLADIRTTTFALHATPHEQQQDNGVTVVKKESISDIYGYLQAHVDAPQPPDYSPDTMRSFLGRVAESEDGQRYLAIDYVTLPGELPTLTGY